MLYVVVNGLWGPREEGPQEIAGRWFDTLTRLKDIDGPTFDAWHESEGGIESDPVLKPSVPALAEYIERKNTGPDLDVVGYTSSLWARNPGMPQATSAIHAGGTSLYAANSVSLAFRSREVDESAEVIRRAPDILRAFAEVWDIDGGQVYSKPQYRAVADQFDLRNTDPRCGRAVFLSANRAALAPEGLPGTYVRTAHSGLVIDLTRGGTQSPAIETIIETNRQLRAAGALEPLPQPFGRDKL